MINSIAPLLQTVTSGQNILFTADRIKTKSCQCACEGWLYHDIGSGIFTISKGGYYEVTYNADVTSADTGLVSLAIKVNGEVVGGSTSSEQIVTANIVHHVSNTSIIKVPCGASVTIAIGNNSELDMITTNANVVIKKLA